MHPALLQIEQLMNRGLAHHHQGQLQDAEMCYRQAILIDPRNADVLHLLGIVRSMLGDPTEAILMFQSATVFRHDFPEAYSNLGSTLALVGRFQEAVDACQTALRYRPDFADAWYNLGNALRGLRRFEEAVTAYQNSLQYRPDFPLAVENLGITLGGLRRFDEAITLFQQAIVLRPNHGPNHGNLGHVYRMLGHLENAMACYQHALTLQPDNMTVLNNLATELAQHGQIDQAIQMLTRATQFPHAPGQREAHQSLIFMMHAHPEISQLQITEECWEWCRKFAPENLEAGQKHENNREPDRRLRIGYVSPDLYNHPVGRFLLPILENHDREQFETFCYSLASTDDPISQKLRRSAGNWREIGLLNDVQAADLIRADKIDILIDLAMHSSSNRLAIFAYKPAPIQVTYLAYASGTGMKQIDYRLSDNFLDPPEEADHHVETTLRLPGCYWCYEPELNEPVDPSAPAERNGYITFGCLNSCHKVNNRVIDLWGRILREVPASRMILHTRDEAHRRWASDCFARSGIDSSRLELVGGVPRREYEDLYRRIDIALDPFPFGGGTTTCDALWMGVPVITLRGSKAVGRAGVSILSNINMPMLIAGDEEAYFKIAVDLFADLEELKRIRSCLRHQMIESPLMNHKAHCQQIEAIYRRIWGKWCESEE